jgi:hypothetical protein
MDCDFRNDAVLRRMAEDGIELLIACSNGLQMPDRPDPVVHLCGYRSLGESFALLHGDGTAKRCFAYGITTKLLKPRLAS